MAKNYKLEGGQYEHPNEFKLVPTIRGTVILQPEFGNVTTQGDIIEAEAHNIIQQNGVLTSKVTVTTEGADTVLVPTNIIAELDLADELKLMLLFETPVTLPANTFIKIKETNVPVSNIGGYSISNNTPIFFVLFDNTFFPHKVGSGGGTGATETSAGIAKIATQTEVNAGVDDSKIVTSNKLKARLDSLLAGITSTYVKLTQLATETIKGISQIATQTEVNAGVDDSKIVTSKKLKNLFGSNLNTGVNGYQKLPGGLIIQWGEAAYREINSATGEIITLPVAFPNNFLQITATDAGLGADSIGISKINNSQFKFYGAYSNTVFRWIAIGY